MEEKDLILNIFKWKNYVHQDERKIRVKCFESMGKTISCELVHRFVFRHLSTSDLHISCLLQCIIGMKRGDFGEHYNEIH